MSNESRVLPRRGQLVEAATLTVLVVGFVVLAQFLRIATLPTLYGALLIVVAYAVRRFLLAVERLAAAAERIADEYEQ